MAAGGWGWIRRGPGRTHDDFTDLIFGHDCGFDSRTVSRKAAKAQSYRIPKSIFKTQTLSSFASPRRCASHSSSGRRAIDLLYAATASRGDGIADHAGAALRRQAGSRLFHPQSEDAVGHFGVYGFETDDHAVNGTSEGATGVCMISPPGRREMMVFHGASERTHLLQSV